MPTQFLHKITRLGTLHNKAIFESLNLEADEVLFNIQGFHFVEAMFYIDVPVYNGIPSQAQIDELIAKGRRIVILRGNDEMPEHVQHNPFIRIIDGFTYVYE